MDNPDLLEQRRAAGALTPQREDRLYGPLTLLGGGTEQWVALVRDLAIGGPADRARAAQIVKSSWHHPVWTEVVPQLLDTGLNEYSTTQLHESLLMDDVAGYFDDTTQTRLALLQPLLNDARLAVREFAEDAIRRLSSLPSL